MASPTEERLAKVREVAAAVSDLDPAVQQAAIQAVVLPPTQEAANQLWMTLVRGLLLLLVIALAGLLYLLIDDKSSDVILTVFSSLLTGLIGLFAPSPTAGGGQGG